MSYAATLASKFGKSSVWLYEFTRGGVTTRLTSASTDYVDGDSVTWSAGPITHSRFRVTAAVSRSDTEFILPQSNTFARSFLSDLSYEDNSVVIYHEFKDKSPAERAVKFRGRVIGVRAAFTRIVLLAANRFTEDNRKATHPVMQRPCRHALYHTSADGKGCGLDITYFNLNTTATDLTGKTLTIPEAALQDSGYYTGGVLTWNGLYQQIIQHDEDQITLMRLMDGLGDAISSAGSSGVAVDIAPGCDRTRSTCNGRFDNILNFGGFPWQQESPFGGKILY